MTGRRKFLRGIRDKLLLSFSVLVAVIAVFVYVFFPARLERQAMRAVAVKADAIRDVTAYAVSAGLFFGDTAAVREVLNSTAQSGDVVSIRVRDAARRVVLASGSAALGPADTASARGGATAGDESAYLSWAPVMHNGVRIGDLAIGVSLDDVHGEVTNARRLGVVVGLVILAVGFAAVYLISAFVTRPLTAVLQTVEQIAAGDLTRRAAEPPDVEVARLVYGFNQMVDSVARAQDELSALNERLESRVQERTRELRATSETLQSLIDLAPQAILSLDLDWRLTRWNQAAERLYGWKAAEVIGSQVPFIPEDRTEDLRTRQRELAARGGYGPVELEHVRRDGHRLTVLVSAGVLRDAEKQPVGYVVIIADLTERKSLETQLRQAQKMEATGRLAGGVAHDFNNILTVITTAATLMKDSALTPEQRDEVEQILAAALRASGLTRQLLTFSRKQIVKLETVNLNEVIVEMERMLRRLLRENVRLSTSLADGLGSIIADSTQMQQVIMNLIVNASDAMPDGGTVSIATSVAERVPPGPPPGPPGGPAGAKSGRFVRVSVADTGIGMDAATMSRMFEPFFTTKEPGKGTGLGLATTYAVVSQLGGHIDVRSAPGQGTSFDVYFPLPPEPDSAEGSAGAPQGSAAAATGSETVLLVEDENGVRRILRRTLEQLGYAVLDAEDGETALALAAAFEGPIDVLVTDLMMPGMNGRAMADELLRRRPEIRIVFISGYSDETVNREGLLGPRSTFLQKPFSGAQLSKAIRTLVTGEWRTRA